MGNLLTRNTFGYTGFKNNFGFIPKINLEIVQ